MGPASPQIFDVIVVGTGVIGCAVARAILQEQPNLRVCLIEKERAPALHQSGRNSGVIHVGYNQKPGTLKARFVVEGSRQSRAFCREYNIPITEGGILVVATKAGRATDTLQTLLAQGRSNGAKVESVPESDIKKYEPHAVGVAALWAPEGASFDAKAFVRVLAGQAKALGAQFIFSDPAIRLQETKADVVVQTRQQKLRAKVFVNAAGLYADRLASQLGAGHGYKIVPFRGDYLEIVPDKRRLIRSHLYACPDTSFPFLGVHLSRTCEGRVLLGPTASLALGREAYGRFGFHIGECAEMLLFKGFWRLCSSPVFRRLVQQEWKKTFFRKAIVREAQRIAPELNEKDVVPSYTGIRAQLVSAEGRLADDLVVEETPRSLHILNAVSPALTCSLPFADYMAGQILGKL